MKGRRRKRYGTVRKRGLKPIPQWAVERNEKRKLSQEKLDRTDGKKLTYRVEAGTPCKVRRIGTKDEWRQHRTTKAIMCSGYLWRNATHYGLAQGEWEVMVEFGYLEVVDGKPPAVNDSVPLRSATRVQACKKEDVKGQVMQSHSSLQAMTDSELRERLAREPSFPASELRSRIVDELARRRQVAAWTRNVDASVTGGTR